MPDVVFSEHANDDAEKAGVVVEDRMKIEEFEELLEDLDDLAVLAERRDEPTITFEEVIQRLKRDGFLQD